MGASATVGSMGARECARQAGVSTDTLRYYERQRLLPAPPRTPSGYRRYPAEALKRIRVIRCALAMGFSVSELARILRARDRGLAPCEQVRQLAGEKLRALELRIRELQHLRKELRRTIAAWDAFGRQSGVARNLDGSAPLDHKALVAAVGSGFEPEAHSMCSEADYAEPLKPEARKSVTKSKTVLNSAIVLYFVVCFEILIMISPFAGFFYSAFSPFLLGLAKYRATSWLSAFFFTHMVVPPNDFLKFVRILGSVLFSFGIVLFLICALQVYASKFLRRGPAMKGLYLLIRHPQYVALATAGAGLAILWPRFLVVVLWLAMVLVYYLLARDEEGRMQRQHPEAYRDYMQRTGMFLPRSIENAVPLSTAARRVAAFLLLAVFVIGGAFLLRQYTVEHLPLWMDSKVVALAVLAEDKQMMEHRMGDVLSLEPIKSRLAENQSYLVYFLPTNYVMQGLIADTGDDWQLYKRHHTISRFGDWIFHPFTHLGGAHASAFEPNGHSHHMAGEGSVRRLIFVKSSATSVTRPADVFSVRATRTQDFMVDVDVHNLSVLAMKNLPIETAWGKVPTPAF